ncbi:MAG: NAD(P)-binding domain-containing protein [Bacteroidales bacterium]|nr:NAD(P)-binding domain-containing protein [Bacteroidales bacterium]
MTNKRLGIIGGGSWAVAVANILLENGDVELNWWVRDEAVATEINSNGVNIKHLSDVRLDAHRMHASNDLRFVVQQSDILFIAVPSAFVGTVLGQLEIEAYHGKQFVSMVKGIVVGCDKPVSVFLNRELSVPQSAICVVGGPSHAEEVVERKPTFLTVASENPNLASTVQQLLSCHYTHLYTTTHVHAVEWAGVMKNIYAIASGICDGLHLGDNMKAVIVTAALREMYTQIERLEEPGFRCFDEYYFLGDLMVTCWSEHSRNHQLGVRVGSGESVADVLNEAAAVAEGYYGTAAIKRCMDKGMLQSMPVAEAVGRVLYDGVDPRAEFTHLIDSVL